MLRKEGYGAWDQLRLLDFGFAQRCSRGEFSCTHGWLLRTEMSESFLPRAMFPSETVPSCRVITCAKITQ